MSARELATALLFARRCNRIVHMADGRIVEAVPDQAPAAVIDAVLRSAR